MELSAYKAKNKLYNKNLLSLKDYSVGEIYEILHWAFKLKDLQRRGKKHLYLKGKTLAMIFPQNGIKTRLAFEQGIRQLGGYPIFLSNADIQPDRGEAFQDTARVLSHYNIDGVALRTLQQSDIEEFARNSKMPVINGLSNDFHPCQALADLMTIYEAFGKFKDLKLTFFGDGNNVASSLLLAGAKVGLEVCICSPSGYEPNAEILIEAQKFGKVWLTNDINEAITDCNIVYTDAFISMGQENNAEKEAALMPYQVNSELMKRARKDVIFMHCLPAIREKEVTAEVIDSPHSVIFEQAENKLHAQKAVMYLLMK